MNKTEFLNTLNLSLSDFKEEERKDILYDYEEHFRIGEEKGKSEDELINELGDPNNIANQYRASSESESVKPGKQMNYEQRPIGISIMVAFAMILFNLIFIIGPYLGLVGCLIGFFAGAIGITIGGAGIIIALIIWPIFPNFVHIPSGIPMMAFILVGIGTIALGLLFLIGMCYAAKFFWEITVKYVKWNIKVITG